MNALVDGQRQDAAAEQLLRRGGAAGNRGVHPLLVEAGIGAQRLGRGKVGDQHVDRPVGAGLQDELAVELERGAEQNGQHDRLGQQPRDRLRIGMAGKNRVEHRPELDAAAAHVERAHLEGHTWSSPA